MGSSSVSSEVLSCFLFFFFFLFRSAFSLILLVSSESDEEGGVSDISEDSVSFFFFLLWRFFVCSSYGRGEKRSKVKVLFPLLSHLFDAFSSLIFFRADRNQNYRRLVVFYRFCDVCRNLSLNQYPFALTSSLFSFSLAPLQNHCSQPFSTFSPISFSFLALHNHSTHLASSSFSSSE